MLEEQVKNELREVRYYFSRKANMDALSIDAGDSRAKALANKYVKAVAQAPARIYDLFGCLYIQNKTYETIATEMFCSEQTVRRLVKELTDYFARKFI